jgi:subtilisin family serine protease
VVDFRNFHDGLDPDDSPDVLHGLKVYGVVAAETDGLGAEGLVPRTRIFVAERCSIASGSYNDVLLWLCGLKEAVQGFPNASEPNPHPVDVICCAHTSGGPRTQQFSDTMARIISEGRIVNGKARGALVVYAAGNDDDDVKIKNGFADDPNTIAVANCRVESLADPDAFDRKKFTRVSSSNFREAIDLCCTRPQSCTLVPGGTDHGRAAGLRPRALPSPAQSVSC